MDKAPISCETLVESGLGLYQQTQDLTPDTIVNGSNYRGNGNGIFD